MQIDLAKESDLDGILALANQIYRVDKPHQNAKRLIEGMLKDDYCDVVVARDGRRIIGSATIFYLPIPAHGKPCAFLEGTVVDSAYRGKGVGSKIMEKLIQLAWAKDCYKFIANSGLDRDDIHKFYAKHGSERWGYEYRLNLQ